MPAPFSIPSRSHDRRPASCRLDTGGHVHTSSLRYMRDHHGAEDEEEMTNEPLNNAELALISQLLQMAADDFTNHGCNDLDIENTQENRFLMLEFEKDNKPDDPYELMFDDEHKFIYANDAAMMGYLARRVKTQVKL